MYKIELLNILAMIGALEGVNFINLTEIIYGLLNG